MESETYSLKQTKSQRFVGISLTGAAYLLAKLSAGEDLTGICPSLRFNSPGAGPAGPAGNSFREAFSGQILLVVPDSQTAERIVSDLKFFTAGRGSLAEPIGYGSWDVLPFDALSPSKDIVAERLNTLRRLTDGEKTIVVASVDAVMQRTLTPSQLSDATLVVEAGTPLQRDDFIAELDRSGYIRSSLAEEVGQIAVRGAVIDIFPAQSRSPVRIELFGDLVESVRVFDPSSQRSTDDLRRVEILPVTELLVAATSAPGELAKLSRVLRERAEALEIPLRNIKELEEALVSNSMWPGVEHLRPLLSEQSGTIFDFLSSDHALIIYDEPAVLAAAEDFSALIAERATLAQKEGRLFPPAEQAYLAHSELEKYLAQMTAAYFDTIELILPELLDDDTPRGHAESERSGNQRDESSTGDAASSPKVEILPNSRLSSALHAARSRELPFEPLAEEIRQSCAAGREVLVSVSHRPRMRRLTELLESYKISASEFVPREDAISSGFGSWWSEQNLQDSAAKGFRSKSLRQAPHVTIIPGLCDSGLIVPADGFQLIVDTEIFPEVVPRRKSASAKNVRRFLGNLAQFKEDDFIVHSEHGIGVYRGLKQMTIEGRIGDFLFLEYAEGAKLFLPVENIGSVQKYVGAEGKAPALTKLGAKTWAKTKSKVKENVAELAGQLVKLYAQRAVTKGISYGEIDSDDLKFADTFVFEETPDQAKAIEEVLGDMSSSKPMDRLVCGDVGYGKTEVALRAAFKSVNRGKQVAILVPTTVLADQHYNTFRGRFAEFPFQIGCVSRFQSAQENREVLERVALGKVDIVVGTHRLLQRDVTFADLGLVIIDEEHRFGVAHKEKLKKLREEVDVLTLTATPIPRTLHMSLVGIRDLSVIETPPCDRQVIRTYVATYEERIIREALLREIGRGGQVFYIYNRVESIATVAAEVAGLVPEARVAFAHGQMGEGELAPIMHSFVNREIDVLVSTTIVESGLDIPNANTIIIRDADRFGLAELYQLRGRVGRSSRRAYAYLLIADPARLGPDAKKRLKVLQSLDDLGMGFRLALQDMEIRGAGNLLGRDQSGQINLVGFELYSRVLKEAIQELRARKEGRADSVVAQPAVDPEVNIGFPAHIPPFYVPDVAERLLMYQRLVDLQNEQEGLDFADEIEDRFGKMPREVEMLVELMIFRTVLKGAGIVTANYRGKSLNVAFHPHAIFDRGRLITLVKSSEGSLRLTPTGLLTIAIDGPIDSPAELTQQLKLVLYRLKG